MRLSLSAEPHMQFLGCRLCWENPPLVATLRPLTAPGKACVKTSSGQRLAVHSNIGTGLRLENKLLCTRTLAHTHTHTFHTHPKRKTIEWPAILCPLDIFPLGFVGMLPDTHIQHTHTPTHHTKQVYRIRVDSASVSTRFLPPACWPICNYPHTCTHHHINATH